MDPAVPCGQPPGVFPALANALKITTSVVAQALATNRRAFQSCLRTAVERMGEGQASATALALVIHELATNSMKYGALSMPAGTLDVSSVTDGDDLVLTWLERECPCVAPLNGNGFGSKLVQRSVSVQRGEEIDCEWDREGLIVTLRMRQDRLAT